MLKNELIKASRSITDVTPGKCLSKNAGTVFGSLSSCSKSAEGRNSVHVKEPSRLGIAMNMKSFAGQICKWLGDMAHFEDSLESAIPGPLADVVGKIVNSHHSVSMYSCW